MDHVRRDTAVFDGKLHDRARELRRADDLRLEVGFLDVINAGDVREVLGAADAHHLAVSLVHVIVDRGARRDEVEVELSLETLLDDLHMEETEEANAEAKAKGHRGLGRPDERWIVDVELLEGVAKVLVLFVVHREESGVDHGLRLAIARHGGVAGPLGKRDGVADTHGLGVLETRDDEADLAHAKLADEGLGGTLDAHAISQEALSALHHEEVVALGDVTVEHAHGGNNATVLVKVGVENQRLKRSVVVSLGR